MKQFSLLALRVSLGLLMVVWGLDKLVNVEHGVRVSSAYYFGLFDSELLLQSFGVLQLLLGMAIVIGLLRAIMYPLLLAITGTTLLGVWRSIVDPWGWFMEGGNALFFPSLIIFAAASVVYAFRAEDTLALDARR